MLNINSNPVYSKQIQANNLEAPAIKPDSKKISKDEINQQSKASTEMADKAYDDAIKKISELLEPKEISVSMTYDSKSGIKNTILTDKLTGKKIIELPPEGVVEMAEKARIENLGALIDKFI